MSGKSKRRWLQFGLRSLLILMLCAACYFGGWQSNEIRRRAQTKPSILPPTAARADYNQAVFSFYVGVSEARLTDVDLMIDEEIFDIAPQAFEFAHPVDLNAAPQGRSAPVH